jgi:hypothetical protein
MRLAELMCCCLLLAGCDRGPTQPASPSGTIEPVTAAPVAEPAIHEAPARGEAKPIAEMPTAESEPEVPDAIESKAADEQIPTEPARDATGNPEASEPTGECCRTCHKGKACGDTCVARDRECTVAPGCACDA